RDIFADERRTFRNPDVLEYLDECETDLLENLEIFTVLPTGDQQEQMLPSGISVSDKLLQYTVNVVLDNSATKAPPILIETYPTYVNLFGTIEKKMDKNGYVKTDFTQIKAGALLRADGGYLIVNAVDLLHDDTVWQNLKRLLLYGRLEIQSVDTGSLSHSALKPKHIDSNVKVIMLGDYDTYMWLYEHEPDFKKMFKIPAEFDYETDRGPKMMDNYARFIAKVCSEESLPHANPHGVATIIEWAVAQTEDKDKITINFSEVADLIREAAFFAAKDGKRRIDRRYVEVAIRQRQRRTELQDHKIQSQIFRGTVLIDTSGRRIGQINGLTVYSTGLISFGKPARISVTTGAGASGLVNIEREADFSGNIHTKGVYIIGGLLRRLFAQRRPLALTATIAFEQSYGGIDGDSASAAEMYALISSLSGIPIQQNIACTGSINQMGDIQPVGGVNEKIKGFFEICAKRGLTGTQGVIIPAQNVVDLMLDERIIAAIRAKTFHIYPIERLDEGAEILMET
ncbi:MAG: Lon protease family protein, partial [Candidatus Kapaibacterium sp.]